MAGLILFTTSNCPHCPAVKELVEDLKSILDDSPYDVLTAVVDQDPNSREMAINWGVKGVPTIIFFENGEESFRKVGPISKAELEKYVEGSVQRDVLPESSGRESHTSSTVLCGISKSENETT